MPQLQSWKASFEEEVGRTKLDENEVFSFDCVSFHITGLKLLKIIFNVA